MYITGTLDGQMLLLLLPPATKLGQGNVFTGVCDSVHRGGLPQCMLGYPPPGADPPARQTPLSRRPPLQAHTQGRNSGGSDPGPHPGGKLRGIRSRPTARGKLRGIRSRPTPKGKIEGDQIPDPGHTQGGNSGGSGPGQHPRGKFRGIRTNPPPR